MGKLFAAVVLTLLALAGAQAAVVEEPTAVYRLEGYWLVEGTSSNGKSAPDKATNPQVYSGLDAANTIFGGTGYAISTDSLFAVTNGVKSLYVFQPGDLVYIRSDGTYTINRVLQEFGGVTLKYEVNKMAFLDGFEDTRFLSTPQLETFSRDDIPPGYDDPQARGAAYSAWVTDHVHEGEGVRNYAFVPVPEPQAWMLMLAGALLLALFRAARKTYARV